MFTDKHILIIGGTSGFGKKVAELALAGGAKVTITGRNLEKNHIVEKELSEFGEVEIIHFEAINQQSFVKLFDSLSVFDHVISMLGGAMGGGFLSADIQEIEDTINNKFHINLYLAKEVYKHINDNGSLIFTSGAGERSDLASGAIIGNKSLNEMVRGLALELAPNIRVNAIAPTWTPTELWRNLREQELIKQIEVQAKSNPLQRVSSIDEVAKGYIFLMSCSFINGQVITIDGGVTLS